MNRVSRSPSGYLECMRKLLARLPGNGEMLELPA
jgi:hypothetical protein